MDSVYSVGFRVLRGGCFVRDRCGSAGLRARAREHGAGRPAARRAGAAAARRRADRGRSRSAGAGAELPEEPPPSAGPAARRRRQPDVPAAARRNPESRRRGAAARRRAAAATRRCRPRRRPRKAKSSGRFARRWRARAAISTGSTTGRSMPTRERSTTRRSDSSSRRRMRSARRISCSRRTSPTKRLCWRLSWRHGRHRYTRLASPFSFPGVPSSSAESANFELSAKTRGISLAAQWATSFFSQPAGRKTTCQTSACARGRPFAASPPALPPTFPTGCCKCQHLATDLKQSHNM